MKLLGLETSSARGSIAISTANGIIERELATPREQTERLLALADELLTEAGLELAELDGIAFGRGPGSFTGLRVAAAIGQGFALATGVPLLPVSSLAVIAQGVWRTHRVAHALVCVDARMGEVYSGEFEIKDSLAAALAPERVSSPAAVSLPGAKPWTAVGDGFAAYADALRPLAADADLVIADAEPAARDLFPLAAADLAAGRATPVEAALPVYLRDESAWRR